MSLVVKKKKEKKTSTIPSKISTVLKYKIKKNKKNTHTRPHKSWHNSETMTENRNAENGFQVEQSQSNTIGVNEARKLI